MPVNYRPNKTINGKMKTIEHVITIDGGKSGAITKQDVEYAINLVKSLCYEYPKGVKHGKFKGRET